MSLGTTVRPVVGTVVGGELIGRLLQFRFWQEHLLNIVVVVYRIESRFGRGFGLWPKYFLNVVHGKLL